MSKMTRFFGGAIFATVLLLGAGALLPQAAQAASLTSAQINAIIGLLQSFGADQSVVANVQTALGGTPTGGGTNPWCHTFNRDLTVGGSGDDVSALNQALTASGIDTTGNSSSFTENSAGDVVSFQAKYGIRQTGYVGPITRRKLNSLYGCKVQPPLPIICDYPAPPQGCGYIKGSSYNPATSCGMELSCSSTLQVISPNGGEQWQKGTMQNIKWTAPSSVSSVSISLEPWVLCLHTNPRCALVEPQPYVLTASTQNDDAFEWMVGKDASGGDIPAGQYIVGISAADGSVSDSSDAPFSIVSTTVGSLSINPTSAGIKVGGTTEFQAMYQSSYSCEPPRYCAAMVPYPVQATWTSSNPKVATVAYKEVVCPLGTNCLVQQFDYLTAVVTGVSLGSATIVATYTDSSGAVLTASAPVSTVMQ